MANDDETGERLQRPRRSPPPIPYEKTPPQYDKTYAGILDAFKENNKAMGALKSAMEGMREDQLKKDEIFLANQLLERFTGNPSTSSRVVNTEEDSVDAIKIRVKMHDELLSALSKLNSENKGRTPQELKVAIRLGNHHRRAIGPYRSRFDQLRSVQEVLLQDKASTLGLRETIKNASADRLPLIEDFITHSKNKDLINAYRSVPQDQRLPDLSAPKEVKTPSLWERIKSFFANLFRSKSASSLEEDLEQIHDKPPPPPQLAEPEPSTRSSSRRPNVIISGPQRKRSPPKVPSRSQRPSRPTQLNKRRGQPRRR